MMTDALLSFVPLNGNLSLVGGAGVDIVCPNIIDLLGNGIGVAPTSIFGNTAVFGSPDALGVGGARPEMNVVVGTSLVTGNAATLTAQLQGAPDPGAAGNYTPLNAAYVPFASSGGLLVANLTAGTVFFRTPWLPPFPANLRPRFLRLVFKVPAGTNFSAGTISSALVTTVRDDQFNKYAAKNFTVA